MTRPLKTVTGPAWAPAPPCGVCGFPTLVARQEPAPPLMGVRMPGEPIVVASLICAACGEGVPRRT